MQDSGGVYHRWNRRRQGERRKLILRSLNRETNMPVVPDASSRRGDAMLRTVIAAFAGAALLALHRHGIDSARQRAFAPLALAMARIESRPIRAAVSADLPFRPYSGPRRDSAAIDVRPFQALAASAPDAVSPHARAVTLLLSGHPEVAAEMLTHLTARGADANVWCDLSASLLTIAERTNSGDVAIDALSAATRAIELDETHVAARFNRVLALERLGLTTEASEEARKLAHIKPGSPWTAELRQIASRQPAVAPRIAWAAELKMIEGAPENVERVRIAIRAFPQQARTWAETLILGSWADAILADDATAASSSLRVARAIGDALEATSGEATVADTCRAIDRASGDRLRQIAIGIRDYRDARIAHSKGENVRAEATFRTCAETLRQNGVPLFLAARY
ncbi:MAG: hypothetical protein ACJ74H_20200, partial [Thermoanaerobaculia bacterium]